MNRQAELFRHIEKKGKKKNISAAAVKSSSVDCMDNASCKSLLHWPLGLQNNVLDVKSNQTSFLLWPFNYPAGSRGVSQGQELQIPASVRPTRAQYTLGSRVKEVTEWREELNLNRHSNELECEVYGMWTIITYSLQVHIRWRNSSE